MSWLDSIKKVASNLNPFKKDDDKSDNQAVEGGCGNTINYQGGSASDTAAVCVNSPHIIQHPAPPNDDSGFFENIVPFLSALATKIMGRKEIRKAREIEDRILKDINHRDDLARKWEVDDEYQLNVAKKTYYSVDKDLGHLWSSANKLGFNIDKLDPKINELIDSTFTDVSCCDESDYQLMEDAKRSVISEVNANKAFQDLADSDSRYNCTSNALKRHKYSQQISGLIYMKQAAMANEIKTKRLEKYDKKVNLLKDIFTMQNQMEGNKINIYENIVTARHNLAKTQKDHANDLRELALKLSVAIDQDLNSLAQSHRATAQMTTDNGAFVIPAILSLLAMLYDKYSKDKDPCRKHTSFQFDAEEEAKITTEIFNKLKD